MIISSIWPERRLSIWLVTEGVLIFLLGPILLYFFATTRTEIYLALIVSSFYCLIILSRAPRKNLKRIWTGIELAPRDKRRLLYRFFFIACLLFIATVLLVPERLFQFPMQRPILWTVVMVLYPLLSVLPQELLFRTFLFERYENLWTRAGGFLVISGLSFGLSHLVLNNWVAPVFTTIAGALFAESYRQHRSLKWAVIEHTLYGNFVFTVGIGWYFYTGNWRPN